LPNHGRVEIGQINAVFGLKGWLKVFSFTNPKQNILDYPQVTLTRRNEVKVVNVVGGQIHGKNILLRLDGVNDRDSAQELVGFSINVDRTALPEPVDGEYYWMDLIGLNVVNREGVNLGKVDHLFETGANDVLMLKGDKERAIPFLQGQTILSIDLANGSMIVDWDPDF
jgi:16S rRNA processing protein RimM